MHLTDLTRPRNQDVVAFIEFLQRLEEASISAFNLDPSTFTPTSASLPLSSDDSDGHESITTAPRGGTRRARSHRSQQRSPTPPAYLIPNRDNNCFLNAALCLALAAFDGQSLPDSSNCTPAAAAFFFALVMIKDNMFEGNPLPQHVLVRFHQESITVGHMHLFQSTQSSPCTTINICANWARSHRSQQRSPTPPAYLIPNRDNNCFLNAALCLALAAFDGQSLPDSSNCTPAAAAFFFALVMIKDNMFEGNPLPQHVLVRFHQESITVGHMHLFQSTQSSPCTTINICANSLNFQFPHRSFSGHRCWSSKRHLFEHKFAGWRFSNGCCSLRFRGHRKTLPRIYS